MELNQQVANLTDDVNLLKGEIKTILTELRTAVLSSKNPFSSDAGKLSSGSADADRASSLALAAEDEPASPEPPPPVPVVMPALSIVPPTAPPADSPPPGATGADPPAAGPGAPPPGFANAGPKPGAGPGLPPANASAAAAGEAKEQAGREAADDAELKDDPKPAKGWNLLTVVSLAAWAEEAIAQLGPKAFQVVLDLSRLAKLITPETKDVLVNISQLSAGQEGPERPIKINECLVLVRQLEAILHGGQERITVR